MGGLGSESTLRELEERRLRALVAADMETAALLHAEDYELVTPGGRTLSGAEYLAGIASSELRYAVFEPDSPVRVRVHASGGTVRYIARIEVDQEGQRFAGRYWHTDVWEVRNGAWQAVWSHATRIPEADGGGLTETDLAERARTSPDRIRRLVEIGVVQPDATGRFAPADLQRVQIIDAFERGGVELGAVERAIREGRMTFDFTDRIYPEASPPSGRTLGDLMAELGPAGAVLPELFLALGRPRPAPDRPLTEADEEVLPMLVAAWSSPALGGSPLLRAARLLGDSTRRLAEGWVNLFVEALALPPEVSARMTVDELRPRMIEPALAVAETLDPAVTWLLAHHLEQALNELNIEAMERALAAEGGQAPAGQEPPAFAFADMTGYTRLTEEHGDELAARYAETLGHLALVAAAELDGRLVKQLGDGVMLAFPRAAAAIEASARLMAAARESGLPELHIGISAGPVIERDGDYFGRTVNLASRISNVAGPAEIVLDPIAAEVTGASVVALGPVELKGLPAPVPLFRLDTSG